MSKITLLLLLLFIPVIGSAEVIICKFDPYTMINVCHPASDKEYLEGAN